MSRSDNAIVTLKIVKHCAQECAYQYSGELSVGWMVEAWLYAQARQNHDPEMGDVIALGKLVEPSKNKNGLRKVGVRVGQSIKMPHGQVRGALQKLFKFGISLPPEEFFREYEEIHPFVDGNGRTGNILFNWLKGTLADPEMPPDFWNQGRIEGPLAPPPTPTPEERTRPGGAHQGEPT